MKISDLIAVLQANMATLGDRELLEGVTFGRHRRFQVEHLLDGDYLDYPGKAIMFLLPVPVQLTDKASLSPGEQAVPSYSL